jgi:hypothetical protein
MNIEMDKFKEKENEKNNSIEGMEDEKEIINTQSKESKNNGRG